jgi:hypothetical protein
LSDNHLSTQNMKLKLTLISLAFGLAAAAQCPRIPLYEEFTGENCPPCASTNPGLNTLLLSATNATRIVAIKWQVPIPSAPSNTWSLYQTNKIEIDYRWKSGGYGYSPAINSAPSSKIDGREATVFGASSGHPANLNNNVIAKAASMPSAFNIIMTRDPINGTSTSAVVNVTIQATMPYSTTSNLVFRNVLVERNITFSVAPGTNGEKIFEDPVRISYPSLQAGTTLQKTWTRGQVMTFSMNCVFPSYIHDKNEIEFVGFIQNDGTKRVEQTTRTDLPRPTFDAVASPINPPFLCSAANTIAPVVPVKNNGQSDITALTITPYIDGVAGSPTQWSGVIKPGFSDFIQLDPVLSANTSGVHTFSYDISGLNGSDVNTANNMGSGTFYSVVNYQSAPIAEGFGVTTWPYANWLVTNADEGSSWSFAPNVEGFGSGAGNSLKYGFFKNSVMNDVDELLLPPVDLTGVGTPVMSFDIAYKMKAQNSSDKLEVKASSDCGNSWTTVWTATGSALAYNQFVDASEFLTPNWDDWQAFNTTLPGFNLSNVLVKFVATNRNGNNLYIDNINLASSAIPDGINEVSNRALRVGVYPNPGTGAVGVSVHSPVSQAAKIAVLTSLGQIVTEKSVSLDAGLNTASFDLTNSAPGIYFVSVETAGRRTVSKVSIAR